MFTQYVCEGGRLGRAGKNTLTVRPSGVIGLGRLLVDELGLQDRTDVLLFYDGDKDLIAMKFLQEPQHGSLPVREVNLHRSINHNGFAKHYEIEPGEYHLLEHTGNDLFVFARNGAHLRQGFRRMIVEVPSHTADEDLREALTLIEGRLL